MEDGQIGTVKFVDDNEEERFTVQLYVACRNSVYYIISNEIPGELSRENKISSHVKITYLQM